jgi:acetylornithine deacetylase
MSVTVVNAGTQHNVVPDTCTFVVDIRINECYSHDEVLAVVRQHVHCDVKPRSVRLRSTAIGLWHPVVIAGKDIGLAVFGSATLSDKALMPFPAVKMGPGDSARSHTADEFIYLAEIKRGIEIYVQLLKAVL